MRMMMHQNGNLTSPNAPLLLRPNHPQNARTGSGSYTLPLSHPIKFFTARKANEFSVGEDDFFVMKKNNVDDPASLDASRDPIDPENLKRWEDESALDSILHLFITGGSGPSTEGNKTTKVIHQIRTVQMVKQTHTLM